MQDLAIAVVVGKAMRSTTSEPAPPRPVDLVCRDFTPALRFHADTGALASAGV